MFQRDVREVLRRVRAEIDDLEAADVVIQGDIADIETDLTGVITEVVAGTNLSGGGSAGSVTLNVVASPSFAGSVTLGDTGADAHIVNGTVDFNHAISVDGAVDLNSTLNVDGATTLNGNVTIGDAAGDAHVINGTADFNQAVNMDSTLTLSTMTQGSVLFAGASGVVSQDNTRLFWDDSNNRLGVGTNSPAVTLNLVNQATVLTSIMRVQALDASGNSSIDFYDDAGVNQFGFGYDNLPDRAQLSMNAGPFSIVDNAAGQRVKFFNNGRVNIGGTTTDPGFLLRVQGTFNATGAVTFLSTLAVDGNATIGNAVTDTHTINGNTSLFGAASGGGGLKVRTTTQANIYCWGDTDGSGDSAYTGYVVNKGAAQTELWFIGRDGTGNTDGLIFRRAGTTDDLKIDTSGNTFVTGNLAVNTNKFNVTASSGNTLIAGTLGVTGLATLTAGFSLGATGNANSNKITNLTNGSSAQDAAAFGQIATAINAAVSGTANTIAKFTSTNVVGNSNITDNGTTVAVTGALTVSNGATLGDATTDTHTINGFTTINGAAATKALEVVSGASASPALRVINSNAGQTAADVRGFQVELSGSANTTAAASTHYALLLTNDTTRSAGANTLTNMALYASATGAPTANYAIFTAFGDNLFNVNGGASTFVRNVGVSGTLQVDGSVTLGDTGADVLDVNCDLSKFGSAGGDGSTFITGDYTIGYAYAANAEATGYINYYGYNGGTTQFRNLIVADGKGANIAFFEGSTKATTLYGALSVSGNCTLGDAAGDAHVINGTTDFNHAMNVDGAVTMTSTLAVNGDVTLGDAAGDSLTVKGDFAKFGTTVDGGIYISGRTFNFEYGTNATGTGYFNWRGYQDGTTQFRDFVIGDGKQNVVASFTGSSKQVEFEGPVVIKGNVTLGDATSDSHTINGRLTHLCPATPSESNYVQRANGLGALSTMVYAADNVFIAFDADWAGSAWTARDTSVTRLYKNSDTFYIQGSTGNSVDGAASFNTIASFDLATGNASFTGSVTLGDAAGDAHTVNGTVDFNHAVNIDGALTATSSAAVSGAFSAAKSFATGGDLVAPQITSNQNDYAPTGIGDASMLFISSDAARDITGITSGSIDGRHLWVFNEGSFNVTLKQGSGSSAAANRFHLRTGADLVLAPSTGAHLYWPGTKGFWVQIGTL